MELNANGKVFNFVFGYGFLKEINEGSRVERSGIKMNMGVASVITGLQTGDTESLIDTLKKANKTENPRLTDQDIENLFNDNDSDQVFDQVMEELKKSQFTKTATNRALVEMKKAEELQKPTK